MVAMSSRPPWRPASLIEGVFALTSVDGEAAGQTLYGPTYVAVAKIPSQIPSGSGHMLRVVHYNGRYGSKTTYTVKDKSTEFFDLDWKKYKNGLVRFQVARNTNKVIELSRIGRARASVYERVADTEEQWATQQDALKQESEEAQEITGEEVTGCASRQRRRSGRSRSRHTRFWAHVQTRTPSPGDL